MTRIEFFDELNKRLRDIPEMERNKAIQYYEEYFDDAMENGKTEKAVIDAIGSIDKVSESIHTEFAFNTVKQKPNAKNTGKLVGVIVLALFSAPVTLPLAIAFIAVIISLVVAVVAIVVSLGSVAVALVGSAVVTLFISPIGGAAAVGAAFLLVGIGIIFGLITYYAARGCIYLIVKMCNGIYRKLSKKGVQAS